MLLITSRWPRAAHSSAIPERTETWCASTSFGLTNATVRTPCRGPVSRRGAGSATNVPRPRRRTTRPSATRSLSARTAVVVETPNRSTISRCVTNGWSAAYSPRAMAARSDVLTHANSVVPGGGSPAGCSTPMFRSFIDVRGSITEDLA